MNISEDRQNALAHLLVDKVWDDDLIDFRDDEQAFRIARMAIAGYVKIEKSMEEAARLKVASLKRNVLEGTPEWDILFKKYYEEERGKRGKKI